MEWWLSMNASATAFQFARTTFWHMHRLVAIGVIVALEIARKRADKMLQRFGVEIEIDEDEAAPGCHLGFGKPQSRPSHCGKSQAMGLSLNLPSMFQAMP